MRRTDQEFKAEVLRRSSAYQARRKKRLKQMFTTLSCAAVILVAAGIFVPMTFGGNSKETADAAAPENMMIMQDSVAEESPAEAPAAEAPAAEEPKSAADDGAGLLCYGIQVRSIADEEFTELSEEDATLLYQYLEGDWVYDTPDCASDCILTVDGEQFCYHSDCGTFNDASASLSLTLSEDDRLIVNAILENYIALENYG